MIDNENIPTLDVAGYFPLTLVTASDGSQQLELDLSKATRSFFLRHVHGLTRLQAEGQELKPIEKLEETLATRKLHFAIPASAMDLTLRMNNQPVSSVHIAGDELVPNEQHSIYQLAVSETRALGTKLRRDSDPKRDVLNKLPYDRALRKGFDPKRHAPITDLHTHSSAQISGTYLIQAAIEEDLKGPDTVCYPVELLKRLGVEPTEGQQVVQMPAREFSPTRNEGLLCEQKGKKCDGVRASQLTKEQKAAIIAKMDIAPDATMSFSDFDREMYRYRNPFVKHPALAKPIIKKIAEDYARLGVQYAELSTGSMMDPSWFLQMAEAIEEIERDGVGPEHKKPKLRFLVGLPRNASPQRTRVDMEKIKYLARHPYIVGVDLLGYESNKTSEFDWALASLAQWARVSEGTELKPDDGWDFKRDFIIRVHAGETGKNPHNVSEAIRLADKYGVRVRVGHALNATLDTDARRRLDKITSGMDLKGLANQDLFATERCIDSNQVYRTKLLVHNQPDYLKTHNPNVQSKDFGPVKRPIPRYLGSDGGGAIGTGPVQLAYSALASGWTLDQLSELRQSERGYIERQGMREALKTQAFDKLYGAGRSGLERFLAGYKEKANSIPSDPPAEPKQPSALNEYLPEEFFCKDEHGKILKDAEGKPKEKTPILIGGASGSSWDAMDTYDKEQIIRSMEYMVRVCDPKKTYFVLGRVQNQGVSKALDHAIEAHNTKFPTNKFSVLARYASDGRPTSELAHTVSWVHDIPEGIDNVPASMLNFIKAHKGHAIFLSGNDFTAEMAYGAADRDLPHALHEPRKGKLAEVAETAETDSVFRSFDEFVQSTILTTGEGRFFANDTMRSTAVRSDVDLKQVANEVSGMPLRREQREAGKGAPSRH